MLVISCIAEFHVEEPRIFEEAQKSNFQRKMYNVHDHEMEFLVKNGAWCLVTLLEKQNPLSNK